MVPNSSPGEFLILRRKTPVRGPKNVSLPKREIRDLPEGCQRLGGRGKIQLASVFKGKGTADLLWALAKLLNATGGKSDRQEATLEPERKTFRSEGEESPYCDRKTNRSIFASVAREAESKEA